MFFAVPVGPSPPPLFHCSMVRNNVAGPDPGSGAFLTLGSGMEKYPDPGSGMHIPDNFSESLETVFTLWLKILKFFDTDPDLASGLFVILDPGWRKSYPGSGINIIPDPQHWLGISWC